MDFTTTTTQVSCRCTGNPQAKFAQCQKGPNQGKWFYACEKPREEACGWFNWATPDGQLLEQTEKHSRQKKRTRTDMNAPPINTGSFRSASMVKNDDDMKVRIQQLEQIVRQLELRIQHLEHEKLNNKPCLNLPLDHPAALFA